MAKKPTGLAAFTRPKPGADAGIEVAADAPRSVPPTAAAPRRTRGGGETVALTVKVRRTDWQRLRQLADAEGTSIQAMAEVGLSAVLAQYGLPPIESASR